jgi:hypothetical protein
MAMLNGPNLGGVVGSSSSSGRFGDFIVALVGFAVGLPLAMILVVALTYFASYSDSSRYLNAPQSQQAKNDFWGRNAACLKSRLIILLMRQSPL